MKEKVEEAGRRCCSAGNRGARQGADLRGQRGSTWRRLSRMRRRTCHCLLPRDSWPPLPLLNVLYLRGLREFAVGLKLKSTAEHVLDAQAALIA